MLHRSSPAGGRCSILSLLSSRNRSAALRQACSCPSRSKRLLDSAAVLMHRRAVITVCPFSIRACQATLIMRARSRQSMPEATASRTAFRAASTASRLYSIRAACGAAKGGLRVGAAPGVEGSPAKGLACRQATQQRDRTGAGPATQHSSKRCRYCNACTFSSADSASLPSTSRRFSWSFRIASSLPTAAFSLAACCCAVRCPWICSESNP